MVWSELFALNFGFVLDSLRITDRNHISRKWPKKKRTKQEVFQERGFVVRFPASVPRKNATCVPLVHFN